MMKTLLVIATMCYVCGVEARTFGDIFTEDDLRRYVRGNHEVEEFDIIDPFASGGRSKRSPLSESILLTSRLQLSAFKEDFHLELFENPWLVPSDLKIKHMYGTKVHEKPFNGKRCHFHGRSMNHNNSVAIISTCAGVHGVITFGGTEVYVEPLKKDHISRLSLNATNELEQPHIVYKRRLKNESNGFSGAKKDLRHENKRIKKDIDGIDFEYYVGPKFMEIKLVLDHSFVDEHYPDASEYALALMNIASRRFVDSSLGFPIHLYIVSIVELHSPEPFVVYSRLYDTFTSFQNWLTETRINNDDDPNHWDLGILLSGYNYDYEPDVWLSYGTRLPPMCFPHPNRTSCNVVKDAGLGTGFIIVHEIGSGLGLEHDDAEGVGCGSHYIMAYIVDEKSRFKWSSCSRKSLNKLWRGKPGCLDDIPDDEVREVSINDVSPDQPSLLVQCREFYTKSYPEYAAYGKYFFSCEEETNCTFLYCKLDQFGNPYDDICLPMGVPPAEGTSCGSYHYCINGECVSKDEDVSSLGASDGKFSEWETSPCSRSCGGGIKVTRRTCSNPRQAFAGAFCDGQHLHYELCNIQPCGELKTFLEERDDSCAEIDPKLGFLALSGDQVPSSCLKACWNYTSSTWAYHEPFYFEDGIKCWNDIFKDGFTAERRCVAGKCVQFNCYGDEGNEGLYDVCRICGGNGLSCYPHSEDINKDEEQKQDIVLPENATSILVVNYDCETNEGRRALDVQSGASVYDFEGNIFKVGFDYVNGTKCAVNLTSAGPLTVDFLLPLENRSDIGNQKLFTVKYYLPKSSPTFLWRPGPFSLCSVDCGRGTRTREVKCIKILNGEERQVEEDLCGVLGKPMATLSCSIPCWSFTFSPCQNDQTRNVFTKVRSTECKIGDEVVDSSECNQATRPVNIRVPCVDEWISEAWGECSATCGTGLQTRYVYCSSAENERCTKNKPSETKDCYNPMCAGPSNISPGIIIIAVVVVVALLLVLCGIIGLYVRRKKKNRTTHMSRLPDHHNSEEELNCNPEDTQLGEPLNLAPPHEHSIAVIQFPNTNGNQEVTEHHQDEITTEPENPVLVTLK